MINRTGFVAKYVTVLCLLLMVYSSMFCEFSQANSKISCPKSINVSFVSTGVKIKWSKVNSANGYYLYRKKTQSTKFTRIAKITKNTILTYTDKKAQSGNYYIYAVKAYKGNKSSIYKKAPKEYYLKAPELSSIKNNYSSVTVNWKKIKGVNGYYLYRKTGNGSWKKIAKLKDDSIVKYTDKKVVNGKKYTYSLKAYKNDKTSVRSNTKQLKFKKTTIKLSLYKTKLSINHGKSYTLKATPTIKNVSVKWKTSNKSVVSVNSKGKIKAASVGKAVITAYFVYNKKTYKKTCIITVTEKEYSVGNTVNLDGKFTFKIESVKAHNSCTSDYAPYGGDKLIIKYSYNNICMDSKLKIDDGNFSISDQKGTIGKFVSDCPYCLQAASCPEGTAEKCAVVVATLRNKTDYCILRLNVNVKGGEKLTAKFKLKIDRKDSEILSDGKALSLTAAAVNVAKINIKSTSGFKLIKSTYTNYDSFTIDGQSIKTPTCSIEYSYINASGNRIVKYVKAWYSNENYHNNNCCSYVSKKRKFVVMKLTRAPTSYDGTLAVESILAETKNNKISEFIP